MLTCELTAGRLSVCLALIKTNGPQIKIKQRDRDTRQRWWRRKGCDLYSHKSKLCKAVLLLLSFVVKASTLYPVYTRSLRLLSWVCKARNTSIPNNVISITFQNSFFLLLTNLWVCLSRSLFRPLNTGGLTNKHHKNAKYSTYFASNYSYRQLCELRQVFNKRSE